MLFLHAPIVVDLWSPDAKQQNRQAGRQQGRKEGRDGGRDGAEPRGQSISGISSPSPVFVNVLFLLPFFLLCFHSLFFLSLLRLPASSFFFSLFEKGRGEGSSQSLRSGKEITNNELWMVVRWEGGCKFVSVV